MAKTILVVDDDPGVQMTLGEIFASFGYDAVFAEDGREALDRVAEGPPALVILDIMMPRMDGYAFAEELGRRTLTPHELRDCLGA